MWFADIKEELNINCIEQDCASLLPTAAQIIPSLQGKITTDRNGNISVNRDNHDVITQFYQYLQSQHPEADNIYRVTYIWNSLCWQAIYLAFIGVYQVKVVPDFSGFRQTYHQGKIAGYSFQSKRGISAEKGELISHVGQQLTTIFEHWRLELCQAYSCRPGMSNKLTADSLMVALQQVKQMIPGMTKEDLLKDAVLWLDAFGLSNRFLAGFECHQKRIDYWRTSCCQVVKIKGTNVCANCPKLKKKRDVQIK